MIHKRFFLNIILLIGLVLTGGVFIASAAPVSAPSYKPAASLDGYNHFAGIVVRNNSTEPLPSGYTVSFSLDTAALINANPPLLLSETCDDLRISFTGPPEIEIDRLVSGCNTTSTLVKFRTQEVIEPNATDSSYLLNYGNSSSGTPPQNPMNVYAFYDDFEDSHAEGWNAAKGTWTVAVDNNDVENYVYRYTGGGANWALTSTSVPLSDIDYLAKIRAVDSPYTNFIGLAFRIQDQNNFLTVYEGRDSENWLKLARVVNDAHSSLAHSSSYTMDANTWYWLRVQAVGTTVRARIWPAAASEPANWSLSWAGTNFQTNTNIGLTTYYHDTTADWDDIQVRRLVQSEPSVTLNVWWDASYHYRLPLTLTNASTTAPLPVRFSSHFTLDTTSLINSGQMRSDCNDLRVVYHSGLAPVELDRVVENCNSSQTSIWYALQQGVAPGAQNQDYRIYYGNATAGTPPANGMNVFLFFEDWEQGTAHWTGAGGLDTGNTGMMGTSTISGVTALSASQSQLFTIRAGGGDAFSGYIPVDPSKMYAIGVWASAPSTGVCVPVGIDPYTDTYVKGTEHWLWTNEWTPSSAWSWRSGNFTTDSITEFIKIKSELWNDPRCPGSPVYLDNLALFYSVSPAPMMAFGEEQTNLPAPTIDTITDTGPISLGSIVQVSAHISTLEGTISAATLRILSPQVEDIPMNGPFGTPDGTWQASFSPAHSGVYTYRILTTASTGLSRLSPQRTFTVTDAIQPVISPISIINSLVVREMQTLVVQVTDNDALSSVNVTFDGVSHPMAHTTGDQYSYSWQVTRVGTISYSVTAADVSNNTATLNGSFVSQTREADVCTWMDCRQGAASWTIDDGNTSCSTQLENAGIRGTYFYSGDGTFSPEEEWIANFSAAGHEIASHTTGHNCTPPACFPTCTQESLAELPVDPAAIQAYRLTQLEPNIAAIETRTNKPVLSLAWPCGCTDPSRQAAAANYVLGARGYFDSIASLSWVEDISSITPENIMLINAAAAYRVDFINRAYTEGKWAIITSHWDCSGIDYMGAQNAEGRLWVAPVGEVLKYIKVRDASEFTNYNRAGQTISFDVVHAQPTIQPTSITTPTYTFLPITFENLVTLKVHILESDVVLGVTMDNTPVTTYSIKVIDGLRYVTFNAALNTSRHVVVALAGPPPAISSVSSAATVELGNAAVVTANVVAAAGTTLQSVTLRVLSPETHDYSMAPGTGSQYIASFTPVQLGSYTYQVIATNNEGRSAQSTPGSFMVEDHTQPDHRNQAQTASQVSNGGVNILSAEGRDLGRLVRAVLSTNESGAWQDFDWPVEDNWWNHAWLYRRAITLTEPAGLARTNDTVDIQVDASSFAGLTGCNELRIADINGEEIPVQIEGSPPTCHLIFQSSPAANAVSTIYIYYGNPDAAAGGPPSFTTDLNVVPIGNIRTIQNTYFDLDLNANENAGVISRVRLPQGSNANLPLAVSSNRYWGWHQVCASAWDGNITGLNSLCEGGQLIATGLTLAETPSGPISREFTLTSRKGSFAVFTLTYRFYANAPYYHYTLVKEGSGARVMNNFWYANGSYSYLGAGTGGTPVTSYNTYDNNADHVRIASLIGVNVGSTDGTDNDGTDLGGSSVSGEQYWHPAEFSGLNLYVVTGPNQAATQEILARLNAPLVVSEPGPVENVPPRTYESPIDLDSSADWTRVEFHWQNQDIRDRWVQWQIKFYDASGNVKTTGEMSFYVGTPTAVNVSSFKAKVHQKTLELMWETGNEVDLIGFNVYRSRSLNGEKEKLNSELILAKEPGQLDGAEYGFTQEVEPGKRYYYWLEWVGIDGVEFEGPAIVQADYLFLPILIR